MEPFIKSFLVTNHYIYLKIEDPKCMQIIYNLYCHGINENINFEDNDGVIGLYFGIYYKIQRKYDKMKKNYLIAIEKGNYHAMFNLGRYYQNIEKDYEQMEKYYLMATEKNHIHSIHGLEAHYLNNNNILKLLKLYIKINDISKLSKTLVDYSNQTELNEEINNILLEYLNSIDNTILPVSLKLYKQILNKQVDLLEAHFKYTVNGLGFNEAKKDFYQQLSFYSQFKKID